MIGNLARDKLLKKKILYVNHTYEPKKKQIEYAVRKRMSRK